MGDNNKLVVIAIFPFYLVEAKKVMATKLLSSPFFSINVVAKKATVIGCCRLLQVFYCKEGNCCNPSLGLTTKAITCKGTCQKGGARVWESLRMNTPTPK
jgi:hypothetical protein